MLERHSIHIEAPFEFEAGGSLPCLDLVYHCSARPYTKSEKVVWICHALTANSDAEEWWPGIVGCGKVLDPRKYYIVCVNTLCSPYGSSGPCSINPLTGKAYGYDFPKTSVRDIVRANIIVRQHLGIESIDLMLGASIGGFQAAEWIVMEPDVIKRAVLMATSLRVPAFLTAFEETQRMALRADTSEDKHMGLACARAIAMLSYRSFDCFRDSQSETDSDTLFADRACSYQRHQGEKLAGRFDACSYWYLTYCLDSHNIGRGRESVEKAASCIKARVEVVSITSDLIFPPSDSRKMAAAIPGAHYREIESEYGHDGFLLENESIGEIFTSLLEDK